MHKPIFQSSIYVLHCSFLYNIYKSVLHLLPAYLSDNTVSSFQTIFHAINEIFPDMLHKVYLVLNLYHRHIFPMLKSEFFLLTALQKYLHLIPLPIRSPALNPIKEIVSYI